MSQTLPQDNPPYLEDLERQTPLSTPETSSVAFSDKSTTAYPLLKDSTHKTRFLLKTALAFQLYFLILLIASLYCHYDQRSAKNVQRTMRVNDLLFFYYFFAAILALSFGLLGKYLRDFAAFGFVIFFGISFITTIGTYFYLQEMHRKYYMAYGHYLVIHCACLFLMTAVYSVLLVVRMKKNFNKFLLIAVAMVFVDILSLKTIEALWTTNPLQFLQLVKVFALHAIFALYFCINSYLLAKKRGERFYENEIFYAFFTYFSDVLFFFWVDLLSVITKNKKKKVVIKKRKLKKKQKKQRISEKVIQEVQSEPAQKEKEEKKEQAKVDESQKKIRAVILDSEIQAKADKGGYEELEQKDNRSDLVESRDYEKKTTSNLD